MSVIRITKEREAPYVMLDKTALKDKRLSFRAKGLHAYLMSKPDDWRINTESLANLSPKEGREAIMMAMRELKNNGYTRRVTQRDEKGHVLGSDIIVYETPWLAEQDAADHDLQRTVEGLVELVIEPDEPINGLADSRVNRQSGKPKVGLTESRLHRKSANPTLLNNVFIQNTEETTEIPPISPLPTAPTKKGRPKKVQTICPPDYHPTPELMAAITNKYPGANVARLAEAMVDWSQGKGEARADWDATLRTFARHDWEQRGSPETTTTARHPQRTIN